MGNFEDPDLFFSWIRIGIRSCKNHASGSGFGYAKIMHPDPVCPKKLDPDSGCPERLDQDPVNIRLDPKPFLGALFVDMFLTHFN